MAQGEIAKRGSITFFFDGPEPPVCERIQSLIDDLSLQYEQKPTRHKAVAIERLEDAYMRLRFEEHEKAAGA